jgi:hypothetical protein
MSQKIWWDSEGSAMRPLPNEDFEEFANRITKIAWSNAAYVEREKVEDLLKEYDMVNSAFAQDFRARGKTK